MAQEPQTRLALDNDPQQQPSVSRTVRSILERHHVPTVCATEPSNPNNNARSARPMRDSARSGRGSPYVVRSADVNSNSWHADPISDHKKEASPSKGVRPDPIGGPGPGNNESTSACFEEDMEAAELSRLRCQSVCTEVIAEKLMRRKNRCEDYPGFAFGSSVFGSDTMMKFSIIKNELHNILNSQLKRVSFSKKQLQQYVCKPRLVNGIYQVSLSELWCLYYGGSRVALPLRYQGT